MKSIPVIALLALAAVSQAQITKSGPGYLFRMKHTAGATLKYGVVSSISGLGANGQPLKITLPMTWKVASVKNGVATIDTLVGPVTMGTGQMGQAEKNRIQIDSLGKLTGQAGSGQQVTPTFPTSPVKIGGSWSANAPIELPMQGQQKITATYTFKGMKMVNGKQMAELAVKTSGSASGTGTMLLLASDGSLFKSNINLNLKMQGANGTPTTYKVTANISRK